MQVADRFSNIALIRDFNQSRVIQCNLLEWISEHTPPENRTKEYYDGVILKGGVSYVIPSSRS